jgi:alpha-L-fucosidase 2
MKNTLRSLLLLAASALLFPISGFGESSASNPPAPEIRIDWPAYLGRHDLVWEQLPRQWNEGAFLGNGQLGLVAYATLDDNRFDLHLGRTDVTDHRKAPDRKSSLGVPGASVMWDYPRLDIGRMALRPAGRIVSGTLRQQLWNAELTSTLKTDLGELHLRVVTLRDRMVHLVEVTSTERQPDGKPAAFRWEFLPGNPISPRAIVRPEEAAKRNYQTNPDPQPTTISGLPAVVQPLTAGGDYATAWLEQPATANQPARLFISTANETPAAGRSAAVAVAALRAAAALPSDQLLSAHRAWWHALYPRSFLTVPDARLESFYWIQMFKLAACLREDGPALDVLGPFYRTTQWPGLWWNLNVQLSYLPVYAGNHLPLGETFMRLMDEQYETLLAQFAANRYQPSLGDFAWALHNYWTQLRFAADWTRLQRDWKPKALATLAEYQKRLTPDAAGRLALAPLHSPEYKGFVQYPNSNYNLGLLRWLLGALLEADARSGRAPDPRAAEWKRIQDALVDYPADKNGLMIGSSQSVEDSHRHYSHLLPLYPLYQLNPDDPAVRDLVARSVRHWHQVGGGKWLAGYSFTGGASLYASLGLGDDAYGMLRTFLTGTIGTAQLHTNTFYTEVGGKNPVIETPLSAAASTMDLLLQSWGGKLRVFPAVPTAWKDATFHQLRGAGAFLVSAERKNGTTAWVTIHSEAGEPCVLKVPDWRGPLTIRSARKLIGEEIAPGEYRLDLRRGETALLFPADTKPTPRIQPLPIAPAENNLYGVKQGGELKTPQFWTEPPLKPSNHNATQSH